MMEYITNFIYAYLSTIGFAVLFNVPKSSFIKSGFAGGLGWVIYIFTKNLSGSIVGATFVASLVIAIIGEIFAIIDKNPITVYIIPGIIPLVPGFGLYNTMRSIVDRRFDLAANHGTEALLISVSIAGALVIVLSINSYRRQRQRLKQ
ncbi:threonine/serine exporter family protein [Alkaliphilus flagellatus]|nr:threonine/serine exporter family protein [Alkaliphilus flagellatus]